MQLGGRILLPPGQPLLQGSPKSDSDGVQENEIILRDIKDTEHDWSGYVILQESRTVFQGSETALRESETIPQE
eukprot:12762978-Alexandrium_andersonii.AAC.1